MEKQFKTLEQYRKTYPNCSEEIYKRIEQEINKTGFYVEKSLRIPSPESVLCVDFPRVRPVTQRTIDETVKWARRGYRA